MITDQLGDFDAYLTNLIERKVLERENCQAGNNKGEFMELVQITAIIGAAASLICTLVVGALSFFIKRTLSSLESNDQKNAEENPAPGKGTE